jgi:hypothetical protein
MKHILSWMASGCLGLFGVLRLLTRHGDGSELVTIAFLLAAMWIGPWIKDMPKP